VGVVVFAFRCCLQESVEDIPRDVAESVFFGLIIFVIEFDIEAVCLMIVSDFFDRL